MRVLFTSQAGEGHWRPLAPLGRALTAAGHEVAFATTPAFCGTVRSHGFTCFPVGVDDDGGVEPAKRSDSLPDGHDPAADVWRYLFAGRRVEQMLPDMLELARQWRPDLVVREISEFSGWLLAEHLDIPHAALQVSAWRPELYGVIADALDEHRIGLGLAPDPDLNALHRHPLLSPIPPAYHEVDRPYPETTLSMHFGGFDVRSDDQRPGWLETLGGRPVVYATLGTAYNRHPELFSMLLAAIADLPVDLILTTGSDDLAARLGPQPANVRVAGYIPQSWLLPHCDLVVSHGGFGTVQAALRHGLPQVLLPIAADQPDNARFCRSYGLAEIVEHHQRSVDVLRSTVQTVLRDSRYRERARAWQRAMQELPGAVDVVSVLERLAGESPSTRAV